MLRALLIILGLAAPAAFAQQEPAVMDKPTAKALFAGGCFWCVEAAFDYVDGVLDTTSGYAGGGAGDASYERVSTGKTGHYEALQVVYDPSKVNYRQLLDVFWENIDPLDEGGQFADRGHQYKTVIFYLDDEQKKLAESSKNEVRQRLGKEIATKILPAAVFYPAEEYHQNYHQKKPDHYNAYKYGSGRPKRLKEIWNK